jgi:hypothetical protein
MAGFVRRVIGLRADEVGCRIEIGVEVMPADLVAEATAKPERMRKAAAKRRGIKI